MGYLCLPPCQSPEEAVQVARREVSGKVLSNFVRWAQYLHVDTSYLR